MNYYEEIFGTTPEGKQIKKYTFDNGNMSFSAIEYGCIVQAIKIKSSNNDIIDVALGFDTLNEYIEKNATYYIGAIVGRFANRIAKAKFSLDKRNYQLDGNDNGNCLHGGSNGYDRMIWNSIIINDNRGLGVKFFRTSEDGEQGFPGKLQIEIEYILTKDNEILMEYKAITDKKTPVNLTNHAYFNLSGNNYGTIKDSLMWIDSEKYIPVDSKLIPTGELKDVAGTAFDFTKEKLIGVDIDNTDGGYDHCFVLKGDISKPCIKVTSPVTKISMEVFTNQIGVQFYSGNFLGGLIGKDGKEYIKQGGFCLETQQFPDAPNQSSFPSCILEPGKEYKAKTIYKFFA